MKLKIYIRPLETIDADGISSSAKHRSEFRFSTARLNEILTDRCLLEARLGRQPAAVAGLDLGRHAIVGPWNIATPTNPDVHRKIIVALERLAVSYGLKRLCAHPNKSLTGIFRDCGYRQSGKGWSRSIIRRTTRFGRMVRDIGKELGIPGDYGALHRLRLQPEAVKLSSIGKDIYERQQKMTPGAADSWKKMVKAASADDIIIEPVSAFRSVDYQAGLVRRKLEKGQSMEQILSVSAAPGYSEHHTGNAIDITTPGYDVLEEPFEDSPAFEWLSENAADFGFILSYPRNNRHGVCYEPWHWCWRR